MFIVDRKIGTAILFLGLVLVSCASQPRPSATPSRELAVPTSTPEPVTEIPSTSTPVPTSTSPPSPTSTPTRTPSPTPAPTRTPLPTPTTTPTPTPTEIVLQPGSYGDGVLSIAVNDGLVTGFYENYTGWDEQLQAPRFSCVFTFVGRIENAWAEIATSDTRGTIELLGNAQVKITLEEEPGGCWNIEPRFDEEGVLFELTEGKEWKLIRMVSSERAYFHDHPDEKDRGESYIIEGDVLKVFEVEEGWVKGEYSGSQGVTTGWIKESDLYEINESF